MRVDFKGEKRGEITKGGEGMKIREAQEEWVGTFSVQKKKFIL